MTTDSLLNALKRVSNGAHPNCVVCGPDKQFGLQLEFTVSEDGGVQAAFDCGKTFQRYPGLLHGGVISSLLDGAMTNCLFAHGRQGLGANLELSTVKPEIPLNEEAGCRVKESDNV